MTDTETPPQPVTTREAAGLVVMAAAFVAGVLALPSSYAPAPLAGLVALVAGSLLLEVELPWGGQVSLGHAVVIGFAGLPHIQDYGVIVGLALALVTLPQVRRYGTVRGLLVMVVFVCASGAAMLGRLAGNALVATVNLGHHTALVAPVLLAGVAYLAVILVLQGAISKVGGRPKGWRSAVNVYASLLCAGALFALAYGHNKWLGTVALVPLLVLRFSFHRYFEARRTYLQATQALAMIPEVAGLIALGHGERSAVYATALAEWMELPPEEVDLAATLARLHHIGQIAHPDLPDRPYGPDREERRLIGEAGADILAETGFLHHVAPLVSAVHQSPADDPELSPLVAVVRVASTLDDLVGQEPNALSDALVGLLARHDTGLERTVALRLAQLCDAHPEVALRAVAAGSSVASAGKDFGLATAARH